jgi:protease YdgD
MMSRALIWVLAMAVLGGSAAAQSAQNSGLRRLSDREDLLGWEAVGRLELAGQGFCTATLIAPDLILTAAHCAFDGRTGKLYPAQKVTFRAGLRDGVSIADRTVRQITVDPRFEPGKPPSAARVRVDVALMRLSEPITVAQADPFVLHSGDLNGAEVSVSSYGKGRSNAISRQRSCQILDRRQGLLSFDCNVTFGSSGSAVFAKVGNRGRILSVVSAMTQMNGRKVAWGMELPSLVSDLKRRMRAEAYASPSPILPRQTDRANRSGTGAKFVRPNGS